MKKSFRSDIKGLLSTLNILTEPHNIEYKIIYEFKYSNTKKICYLNRKVTVFNGRTPVDNKWFDNDLEIIQYISKELATWTQVDKGIK